MFLRNWCVFFLIGECVCVCVCEREREREREREKHSNTHSDLTPKHRHLIILEIKHAVNHNYLRAMWSKSPNLMINRVWAALYAGWETTVWILNYWLPMTFKKHGANHNQSITMKSSIDVLHIQPSVPWSEVTHLITSNLTLKMLH